MSLIILGGMLGLAACGDGKNADPGAAAPSDTPPASAAAPSTEEQTSPVPEERIFTDDFGQEVKLIGTPKRVLAVYLEDPLVSLGVKPLLKFDFGGSGSPPYLQEYLADVPPAGTAELALTPEQALAAEPDVIIAHSLVTSAEMLDTLAKIAPTYGIDADKSDWRTILLKVGELLNLSDKAEQVLKEYDERVAAAKEQLKQAVGDETFAVLRLTGKEYRLYGAGELDPFNGQFLFENLGLKPSKLVQEVPQGGGWALSMEKLPELDADHLILVTNEAGKAQAQEMMNSSIWQDLPAVRKQQVYEVDPLVWLSLGNMANKAKIDDLLARVAK
ncbi:ABC transporter substrate-binding protein [Cohnella cellulosilytica]|uniref:ABC transporter substrate-binding protein n=1 Tax=Cohnella cellulosilytica TaxID=986710 RepID=A0ABW2FMK9_9BACL